MEKIGYSLVDASGVELKKFGDTKGQLASPPGWLVLSNGDEVSGFKVGDVFGDGSKFVERWLDDNPPAGLWTYLGRVVSFDGTRVVATAEYETRAPAAGELLQYAADARYAKEIGGIVVSGIPIATDDRSKQMILGAHVAANADPTFTTDWVGSDGSVTAVNAAMIVAISNAVLAHVNSVFAAYKTASAEINAGTFTTFDQIDAAFQ